MSHCGVKRLSSTASVARPARSKVSRQGRVEVGPGGLAARARQGRNFVGVRSMKLARFKPAGPAPSGPQATAVVRQASRFVSRRSRKSRRAGRPSRARRKPYSGSPRSGADGRDSSLEEGQGASHSRMARSSRPAARTRFDRPLFQEAGTAARRAVPRPPARRSGANGVRNRAMRPKMASPV